MNRFSSHLLKGVEKASEAARPLADIQQDAVAARTSHSMIETKQFKHASRDEEILSKSTFAMGGSIALAGAIADTLGPQSIDQAAKLVTAGGIGLAAVGAIVIVVEKVFEK